MINSDLLKLYTQLEHMEQTKEVAQLKASIQETLCQNLRTHLIEFISIGSVLGYDRLKTEMKLASEFIESHTK